MITDQQLNVVGMRLAQAGRQAGRQAVPSLIGFPVRSPLPVIPAWDPTNAIPALASGTRISELKIGSGRADAIFRSAKSLPHVPTRQNGTKTPSRTCRSDKMARKTRSARPAAIFRSEKCLPHVPTRQNGTKTLVRTCRLDFAELKMRPGWVFS